MYNPQNMMLAGVTTTLLLSNIKQSVVTSDIASFLQVMVKKA